MPLINLREPGVSLISRALDGDVVVLGRSSSCDIVLRDPSVSRRHLEIRRESSGWVVEDLGSSNGSRLNGSPILRKEILAPGDEISLGDTSLTFQALASESMPAGMEPPTRRIRVDDSDGEGKWHGSALVGRSPGILSVLEVIDKVASSDATILITGPNGSGKELVARMIHERSPRKGGPFVPVNCPALPGSLLESELFGVEKGVATGVEPRKGRFQMAQGGTLLLDEIGDMSATAQAGILRVLEEKKVEPIGARTPVDLDARILASTNHDLESDIDRGQFRRDLYHRINTVKIEMPALCERREDIPRLVEHFLATGSGPALTMSSEALEILTGYDYPGNVRELKHVVERSRLLARGSVILPDDLPPEILPENLGARGESGAHEIADSLYRLIVKQGSCFWEVVQKPFLRREISRTAVRHLIERAKQEGGGSFKGAARILGIEEDHKKLLNFLRYHKLRPSD